MDRAFLYILILLILICIGCEKDSQEQTFLKGTWIENISKADTIIFQDGEISGTFYLTRGKELRNGYLLPKYGSGFYDFKIIGNSISVRSWFSSSGGFNTYYFHLNQTNNSLLIGNFFQEIQICNELLTFVKKTD